MNEDDVQFNGTLKAMCRGCTIVATPKAHLKLELGIVPYSTI